MRLTAALALLIAIASLTACRKAIAQNPTLEERVAALQVQVDALSEQLAEVRVPHLFVAATGEDLGPYVYSQQHFGGYGVVTSRPQFTGVAALGTRVNLYYSGSDCSGTSAAGILAAGFVAPLANTAFIAGDGRAITLSGTSRTVSYQSSRNYLGTCVNTVSQGNGFDYQDTGVTGVHYEPQEVTVRTPL